MKRIVITGVGVVSALGNNMRDFSTAIQLGRSAIGPLTVVPTEKLSIKIAAQLQCFTPTAHFEERQLKLLDRATQYALVAAREAIADSGIEFSEVLSARTAVVLGSGIGGATSSDESYRRLYGDGEQRLHPLTVPKVMFNAAASHITIEHRITGPSFMVALRCLILNNLLLHCRTGVTVRLLTMPKSPM